jgi:tRNA (pseudouridine54-N1)-methyltransferase
MRRFVVICNAASASDDFLLDDLPGTSGRLDVGLRCVRAALLVSHGVRRDVLLYLVLGGGPRAPRVLCVRGADARFLRPDERSLAVLAKKSLASRADEHADAFVEVRPAVSIARGGLDRAIADLGPATPYVLDESGTDIRDLGVLDLADSSFFLGDHVGLDRPTRARLEAIGARSIRVGPQILHAEDAIAIVSNEIDRREASSAPTG